MARYIDADEVYELLNGIISNIYNSDLSESECEIGCGALGVAQKKIENIPAADVRPIIHGKWIELPGTRISNLVDFKCSVCGGNMCMSDDCELEWCGRCGAKMDGKAGDEND